MPESLVRHKGLLFAGSSLLLIASSSLPAFQKSVPAPPEGQQIFSKTCAPCHGDKGVGGEVYEKPLRGDKSLPVLTAYIFDNMPPNKAKRLSKKDAASVASYVYNAFYSPIAQERNRPARVALSRLTVAQFKTTLTLQLSSAFGFFASSTASTLKTNEATRLKTEPTSILTKIHRLSRSFLSL